MNHKRGRPKSRRAGCLMCKRHKVSGVNDESLNAAGDRPRSMQGARNRIFADSDIKAMVIG